MEIFVEIEKQEAEKLGLSTQKLSFKELKRKMAILELEDALEKSHKAAKPYGIDNWTMDDINNMVADAKAEYNAKTGD